MMMMISSNLKAEPVTQLVNRGAASAADMLLSAADYYVLPPLLCIAINDVIET